MGKITKGTVYDSIWRADTAPVLGIMPKAVIIFSFYATSSGWQLFSILEIVNGWLVTVRL